MQKYRYSRRTQFKLAPVWGNALNVCGKIC